MPIVPSEKTDAAEYNAVLLHVVQVKKPRGL